MSISNKTTGGQQHLTLSIVDDEHQFITTIPTKDTKCHAELDNDLSLYDKKIMESVVTQNLLTTTTTTNTDVITDSCASSTINDSSSMFVKNNSPLLTNNDLSIFGNSLIVSPISLASNNIIDNNDKSSVINEFNDEFLLPPSSSSSSSSSSSFSSCTDYTTTDKSVLTHSGYMDPTVYTNPTVLTHSGYTTDKNVTTHSGYLLTQHLSSSSTLLPPPPHPSIMAKWLSNLQTPQQQHFTPIQSDPINLMILPWLPPHVVVKEPLQLPVDAFCVDGITGISILSVDTQNINCPTLCRFCYCPSSLALQLLGTLGLQQPNESYLYPSLESALSYTNKNIYNQGWNDFYILVVHEQRTYRAPLSRFVKEQTNKRIPAGPGFKMRKGLHFTSQQLQMMCELALSRHSIQLEEKRQLHAHDQAAILPLTNFVNVLPGILEHFLRVIPTSIQPCPTQVVMHGKWTLYPITSKSCPSFIHYNS